MMKQEMQVKEKVKEKMKGDLEWEKRKRKYH